MAATTSFFAANGDLYFTDQGQSGLHEPRGRLFRLLADGRLEVLLNNVPSPNGLVMNKAEDQMLLAVTRANAVWRVPLGAEPGRLVARVGTFIQMSGSFGGPDGMALDEAENLVVAHVGMGSVWVFSRLGEPLYRIRAPAGLRTTNIAFGGAERKTLYITESETGSILTAKLDMPGKLMYSHT